MFLNYLGCSVLFRVKMISHWLTLYWSFPSFTSLCLLSASSGSSALSVSSSMSGWTCTYERGFHCSKKHLLSDYNHEMRYQVPCLYMCHLRVVQISDRLLPSVLFCHPSIFACDNIFWCSKSRVLRLQLQQLFDEKCFKFEIQSNERKYSEIELQKSLPIKIATRPQVGMPISSASSAVTPSIFFISFLPTFSIVVT